MLIYFEPTLQKKLIPVFHYALKPRGFLLLGSAETVGTFGDLFSALDAKSKIFLKRPDGGGPMPHLHLENDFPARQNEPRDAGAQTGPEVWSRLDVLKEADRLVTARYCPPGLVVNEEMEIIQFRGEVAPYLNPGSGEASLNLFRMMRPAFATELRGAIAAARKGGAPVRKHTLHLDLRGEPCEVAVAVLRVDPPAVKERAFVIVFEELSQPRPRRAGENKQTRECAERAARGRIGGDEGAPAIAFRGARGDERGTAFGE